MSSFFKNIGKSIKNIFSSKSNNEIIPKEKKIKINDKDIVEKIVDTQNFVEGYWDLNEITELIKDKYKKTKIKTLGYPGFPTDLQQPITTLLTQCKGISEVHETVYERRFQNVQYLNKMGAEIKINDDKAFIYGPCELKGKKVTATDLRAGACLVLAGLIADGTTTIENVDHILRGYENIIEKLSNVGANIKLVDIL